MTFARQPKFTLSAIRQVIPSCAGLALTVTTALLSLGLPAGTAQAQGLIDGGSTVDVPGTQASPWDLGGTPLVVGDTGAGTLNIGAGGQVVNVQYSTVGNGAGAQGAVTVSGAGALWDGSGSLVVGRAGTGSLMVSGGGTVNSGIASMGSQSSGLGAVTVMGAGSSWTTTGALQIGASGSGALTISNGGAVSVGSYASVADNVGQGTLNVTGSGSSLTVSGGLFVGGSGSATASIADSALVSSQTGYIGSGVNALGTVTVSGAQWDNAGDLSVGNYGRGTLRIEATGTLLNGGAGYIGRQLGSQGLVLVTGPQSSWSNAGDLSIGYGGTGQLTVDAGTKVDNASGYIGHHLGGDGTVMVTGGQWTNSGDLSVGMGGRGTLVVSGGGAVFSANGSLGVASGAAGSATVTGAGSSWDSGSLLVVGQQGDGGLTIRTGGRVSAANGYVGADVGGSGGVTVDGANARLVIGDQLHIGDLGSAFLTVSNGGAVSNVDGYIAFGPSDAGVTVQGANSSWVNGGALYVGLGGHASLSILDGARVSNLTAALGLTPAGTGSVLVDGAGSSWETGSNLYIGYQGSGALTVANGGTVSAGGVIDLAQQAGASGTLNIGAAPGSPAQAPGTLATASLTFGAGSATLNFNHTSANYSFNPALSGNGTINQIAGTTVLTADSSSFNGATYVSGGRLAVNGSLAGSVVTVSGGGILGGSGAVGGIVANAGAVIAPGNSIGTLNVPGSVAFAPGSVYQVEVNTAGQSDRLVAGGSATLTGGTVQVLAGAGSYAPSTTYTILSAAGGRSGSFAGVSSNLAFLTPALSYDANNVYLLLQRNDVGFGKVGLTPNQQAAGGGIEGLGATSALYGSVLTLSAPQARAAYDQLSGELHASARTALLEESRLPRDAAVDRLRAAFGGVGAPRDAMNAPAPAPDGAGSGPGRFAVWGRLASSWGHTDGDGNAARLARSSDGFLLGADAPLGEGWRLGALAGYSRQRFDAGDRRSSGASSNVHAGVYAGNRWGPWSLRAGLAHSWHKVSVQRDVSFTSGGALRSDYDAGSTQVFGELARTVEAERMAYEPYVQLAQVRLRTDGFREQGGAAALSGAGATQGTGFATLGLRAASRFALAGRPASVSGSLGWRHASGDVTPSTALAFAGGPGFVVAGVPLSRDAAVAELGLGVDLAPGARLSFVYRGQFASAARDQSVRAGLDVRF